ncbi:MAG: RNA methyltransferase [Pirellulales bacterium]
MPTFEVSDLEDSRLVPYRNLRTVNWTGASGWFIAEGPLLVDRLLRSSYQVHSVMVSRKLLDKYSHQVSQDTGLIVVDDDAVSKIVGFNFHRGVMACGLRRPLLSPRETFTETVSHETTLVAVQGVQDPENLGGILRSCAALGIEHVIVGPNSADPLSRRVLRVSMGTAFKLNLLRTRDLVADLAWLRETWKVESIATTLAPDSEFLEQAARRGPTVILLGNEAHGLPPELQAAADRRVKIDMRLGTDSLNVSVAAGIVMHYFCRVASDKLRKSPSESNA